MTTNKPEVKRYDCTNGGARHCYGCYTMKEDELGDYVEWEAYESLQAECEKLRAAMIEAKSYIDHYMYGGSTYREPAAQAIALIDAAMEPPK